MKLTVELELLEEVTPEIFAQKLAMGLSKAGVLRAGERVTCGNATWQIQPDVPFNLTGKRGRTLMYPSIKMIP